MNKSMIFKIAELTDQECGQENGPGSEWMSVFSDWIIEHERLAGMVAPNEFEYLIKLLEEYIDPENNMDDECKVKVTRSTNRDAHARKMISMLKNSP